jgi:hypothetical protein
MNSSIDQQGVVQLGFKTNDEDESLEPEYLDVGADDSVVSVPSRGSVCCEN